MKPHYLNQVLENYAKDEALSRILVEDGLWGKTSLAVVFGRCITLTDTSSADVMKW